MKSKSVIQFADVKKIYNKQKKQKKSEKTAKIIRNWIDKIKRILIPVFVIFIIFVIFTAIYYVNYKMYPEDWTMIESRKNDKKCKDFRNKYKEEFDSREIRYVSNKCILSLINENVDCSEIFHYYIGDDGNATFQATANIIYNSDFLNPLFNVDEESTYRTVQVYPGYQDIIQDTDFFYKVENGPISDNWFMFYKTILETNYDEYYIENYFEGFYTNPPDCHGVNISFYKNKKCEKITLLITNNVEREKEFHNYIEGVAKRKWKTDDNNGPLEYLLKYSLNYPNMSYMISAKVDEPTISLSDILIFSFRNCYILENKDPLICTDPLVNNVQTMQVFIFYFGVISGLIIPFISTKVGKAKKEEM